MWVCVQLQKFRIYLHLRKRRLGLKKVDCFHSIAPISNWLPSSFDSLIMFHAPSAHSAICERDFFLVFNEIWVCFLYDFFFHLWVFCMFKCSFTPKRYQGNRLSCPYLRCIATTPTMKRPLSKMTIWTLVFFRIPSWTLSIVFHNIARRRKIFPNWMGNQTLFMYIYKRDECENYFLTWYFA